jgi:NADH:ubiquinone oxidoreductase subunit E
MICVSVCIGTSCHLNGANNVVRSFQHLIEENGLHDKVTISAAFCMQTCAREGVSVKIGEERFAVKPEEARRFFKEKVMPMVQENK